MGGAPGLRIRRLQEEDIFNGLLLSLDSLREASGMAESEARDVFHRICSNPDHVVLVAELDGRVVGAATLLIEQKFIHNGGRAGHIEDVAVLDDMQGSGIGASLVRACLDHAARAGCYKTVLQCTDAVKEFYQDLGFRHHGSGMRFDH